MKRIHLTAIALGLALYFFGPFSAAAGEDGWKTYRYPAFHFSVESSDDLEAAQIKAGPEAEAKIIKQLVLKPKDERKKPYVLALAVNARFQLEEFRLKKIQDSSIHGFLGALPKAAKVEKKVYAVAISNILGLSTKGSFILKGKKTYFEWITLMKGSWYWQLALIWEKDPVDKDIERAKSSFTILPFPAE